MGKIQENLVLEIDDFEVKSASWHVHSIGHGRHHPPHRARMISLANLGIRDGLIHLVICGVARDKPIALISLIFELNPAVPYMH